MEKDTLNNIIESAKSAPDTSSAIQSIIKGLQKQWGFECIAIRIKNDFGDYPYFAYLGFSDDFAEAENTLCEKDETGKIKRDTAGNPALECMCGNILQERFDPSLPFFTKNGSFWTNSTTKLLASTSEKDRQSRTRNRCNGEGYESVGLFPLKFKGMMIGLMQLNDHKKNMFSDKNIEEYELVANYLAETVCYSIVIKDKKIYGNL